ncbi:MFS transporter [Mobilicoccus massiliensis]|nr:MFS transporter [Mobilicoccus massiliensis]
MNSQPSTDQAPGSRRVRLFAAWAGADVVSVLGSRLAALAIPWFVLTTTGSAGQTGLVVMAQLAPMVVTKFLAGPFLDRIGPARGASWLDVASAVVAAIIPTLHAMHLLTFPTLVALVTVLGALRGPADAGKYALVPEVARLSGQPLERVTGVAGTTERLASSVGAAGGGLLIAAAGAPNAIIATAAGFALSAALIGLVLRPHTNVPRKQTRGETNAPGAADARSYLGQLADGWSFVRREPVLRAIAVMVAATNMIDQAWVVVLVPVWATHHGHDSGSVGLAFGTMTASAIAGSLIAATVGARMPRLATYSAGYLLAGLPRFAVFALDPSMPVILTVLAIAGIGSGVLNPIISAVQFERTPAPLVSRVSSLVTAMAWVLMPFGGLLGAQLLDRLGLSGAFYALGAAYLLATLAPLVLPSFRAMNDRPSRALETVT